MISVKINSSTYTDIPLLSPKEEEVPIFEVRRGQKIRNLFIRSDSTSEIFAYVEMPNREKRISLPLLKMDQIPTGTTYELDIDHLESNESEYRYIFPVDIGRIYIIEGFVLFSISEGLNQYLFYVCFPHILIPAENFRIMLNEVDEYQGNYYLSDDNFVFQYFQARNIQLARTTFIAGSRKHYYAIELYKQMNSYLRGSGILQIYSYSDPSTLKRARPLELLFLKYVEVLLETTIQGLIEDLTDEKQKLEESYQENAQTSRGSISNYYRNISEEIRISEYQLGLLKRNAATLIHLRVSSVLSQLEHRNDILNSIGPLLPGNPYLYSMYRTMIFLLSLNKPTALLSNNKISIYGANDIYESWCYFKVLEALQSAGYSYNEDQINILKYSGNIQKLSEIRLWRHDGNIKMNLCYDKYYNLLGDPGSSSKYGYPGGRYRREHNIDQGHRNSNKRNPDIAIEVFLDSYYYGQIPKIIFFDATYSDDADTIEGKQKYKDRIFFINSSGSEESCGFGAWALHPATGLSADNSPLDYIEEVSNSGALALTPGHPNSILMLNKLVKDQISSVIQIMKAQVAI